MDVAIRAAGPKDLVALQAIERAAGQLFAEIGMHDVANDEPSSLETLIEYSGSGRAWVLVARHDAPVGYVLVDVVDGCAHIEQLSVHPRLHRQGYGRLLIERVATWAQGLRMPAVTLTTFRDVPWNAPYYERCGFHVLADADLGPGLVDVRAREADDGLDPQTRVCMRLDLDATTASMP